MRPLLVLCLGNEVLTDDAFGPLVARQLEMCLEGDDVESLYVSVAGFGLLDLLQERRSVLIVDAIRTGTAVPGTLHYFPVGDLIPSNSLINSHQINLPTALELGRQLGQWMPDDIQVLATEADDIETLSEQPTPAVAKSIPEAVSMVMAWVDQKRRDMAPLRSCMPSERASRQPLNDPARA